MRSKWEPLQIVILALLFLIALGMTVLGASGFACMVLGQ